MIFMPMILSIPSFEQGPGIKDHDESLIVSPYYFRSIRPKFDVP